MTDARRPIRARSSRAAAAAAALLARWGVRPDAVSAASVLFAFWAGAALLAVPVAGRGLALFAALMVPLRLLANLLDGMVAVEHGRGGRYGALWNEVPDRVSDVAILVTCGVAAAGLGVGAPAIHLGWAAAAAALATAYLREFGRALGALADYGGPFAKQGRMWAVVVGCVLTAAEGAWGGHGEAMAATLAVLVAGTVLTAALRLRRLARWLAARPAPPAQRTSDSDGVGRASSPRVM